MFCILDFPLLTSSNLKINTICYYSLFYDFTINIHTLKDWWLYCRSAGGFELVSKISLLRRTDPRPWLLRVLCIAVHSSGRTSAINNWLSKLKIMQSMKNLVQKRATKFNSVCFAGQSGGNLILKAIKLQCSNQSRLVFIILYSFLKLYCFYDCGTCHLGYELFQGKLYARVSSRCKCASLYRVLG
jgi:hypothetical protein